MPRTTSSIGPRAPPNSRADPGSSTRITQFAEAGDGRYILELTGIARFKVIEEIAVLTAYRQCKVDYSPYVDDFTARKGEEAVDREDRKSVV